MGLSINAEGICEELEAINFQISRDNNHLGSETNLDTTFSIGARKINMATAPKVRVEGIDRKDPLNSFKKFEKTLQYAGIVEAKDKINYLIHFLDNELYLLIDSILDDTNLDDDEKWKQCRDTILARIKKPVCMSMGEFFKIVKKEDSKFEDFLNYLLRVAKESNIDDRTVITDRFIGAIQDENMKANALILSKQSSLDETAKTLDELNRKKNPYICGILKNRMETPPLNDPIESIRKDMRALKLQLEQKDEQIKKLMELLSEKNGSESKEEKNEIPKVRFERKNEGQNFNNKNNPNFSPRSNYGNFTNNPTRYKYNGNNYNTSRNTMNENNWRNPRDNVVCYYHSRYGSNAWKCVAPCNKSKEYQQKN